MHDITSSIHLFPCHSMNHSPSCSPDPLSLLLLIVVATALLAMYIEASAVAYLAFLIPLFTAPMVISQRRKLNRLPSEYYTFYIIQHGIYIFIFK